MIVLLSAMRRYAELASVTLTIPYPPGLHLALRGMAGGVRLDHVAIIARRLDEALDAFTRLLGVSRDDVLVARGVGDGGDVVEMALIDLGGSWPEIFAPAKPGGASERPLERGVRASTTYAPQRRRRGGHG